jgi:hypothetical protein
MYYQIITTRGESEKNKEEEIIAYFDVISLHLIGHTEAANTHKRSYKVDFLNYEL